MRRQSWIPIALVLLIAAAIVAAVVLRKNSPPEAARLLPEADGLIYLNLKPLRALTHFDQRSVVHDADYQTFIDATGIEVERDLDEAAFAVEARTDPSGPNGPLAYTEVFVGRFDSRRLADYLTKLSLRKENYAGTDVFDIPHEGRTVRVALLGVDIAAASNAPTPEQLHAVLDRYHTAALSFSGSTLLKAHYSDIPVLSMAWAIGRSRLLLLPLGQTFTVNRVIAQDATIVASARYVRSLQVRMEEFASSPEAAAESAQSLRSLVQMVRVFETGSDQDTQQMWRSVTINQSGKRALVKATVPMGLIEKTFGQPGAKLAPR